MRRAKAITSLSSEAISEGADNKRRSLPNCGGRRERDKENSGFAECETSWPFSIFPEPTKRFVAL
jgi:hypothetical protein